jgi:hypothetical protein
MLVYVVNKMDYRSRATARNGTLRMLAAVAVLMALVFSAGTYAAERKLGSFWVINTRKAPWSRSSRGDDRIEYRYLDEGSCWRPSDSKALLATDDSAVPTCVFVHGNRVDRRAALKVGRGLYAELSRQASRPFRFIIWSWPTDRMRAGVLKDVHLKAVRSDLESYYFARWLRRVDPHVPVSLIGYSFGARVIAGALHLLGTGKVDGGRPAQEPPPARQAPLRVVLVAAALDNTSLAPTGRFASALSQVDRALVTRNSLDPVLRWYHRLRGPRGPNALGHGGPACSTRVDPNREKMEVLGLDCSVGRHHAWGAYFGAGPLRARLGPYVLLEPPQPGTDPEDPASLGPEGAAIVDEPPSGK